MTKDASFDLLIEMCEKVGWDKGIKSLESMVRSNENLQADLFAGDYKQQQEAQNISHTIVRQNFTIARLKNYREKNNL